MVNCAVVICKNSSGKSAKNKDGISFHRFPKDKERCRTWEIAVNREIDWTSTSSSAVCSNHFTVNDFYITESGLRRLSIDAVPSINISPCQELEPAISKVSPADIKSTDPPEMVELKLKARRLEVIAANRKKRLNTMWQANKRLQKKLQRMRTVLKHLIKHRKENRRRESSHVS